MDDFWKKSHHPILQRCSIYSFSFPMMVQWRSKVLFHSLSTVQLMLSSYNSISNFCVFSTCTICMCIYTYIIRTGATRVTALSLVFVGFLFPPLEVTWRSWNPCWMKRLSILRWDGTMEPVNHPWNWIARWWQNCSSAVFCCCSLELWL